MISLDGRPIIDHILRYLAKFPEVESFVIVCEFDDHGKQIINYFEGKETIVGKQIVFVEDKKKWDWRCNIERRNRDWKG